MGMLRKRETIRAGQHRETRLTYEQAVGIHAAAWRLPGYRWAHIYPVGDGTWTVRVLFGGADLPYAITSLAQWRVLAGPWPVSEPVTARAGSAR